jgi:hypothetical protein
MLSAREQRGQTQGSMKDLLLAKIINADISAGYLRGNISDLLLYAFFWVMRRRLKSICQRFGTLCLFHLHRRTVCSETLAYKLQTPVNHPVESIQNSEHGESLKSSV